MSFKFLGWAQNLFPCLVEMRFIKNIMIVGIYKKKKSNRDKSFLSIETKKTMNSAHENDEKTQRQ